MRDDIIFIGEAPGPSNDPESASPLYPFPSNSAGGRLRRLTGLSRHDYVRHVKRMNLVPYYPKQWPTSDARANAIQLVRGGMLSGARVVLVGARVRDAFFSKVNPKPNWLEWRPHVRGLHRGDKEWPRFVCVPHPSGRNLWYNDPDNRERVRDFFRELFHGED